MIDRYDIHGKDILEIGCGKGDFLIEICRAGGNRGVGIDPACLPDRVAERRERSVSAPSESAALRWARVSAEAVRSRLEKACKRRRGAA